MALTLAEAFAINPPSVKSRCIQKSCRDDLICPSCPTFLKPLSCSTDCERSSVQFQLTYTCDSSTYAPCYIPTIPKCCPSPIPIRKPTCCCLKWYDCCGNPVFKCCS